MKRSQSPVTTAQFTHSPGQLAVQALPPIVREPIFLPDRAPDRPGFTGDLGNFFLFRASFSQSETWVQHPGELKLLVKARAAHPYLQEHPGSPAPSDPSQDKLQSPMFKSYSALISCEILGTSLPSGAVDGPYVIGLF